MAYEASPNVPSDSQSFCLQMNYRYTATMDGGDRLQLIFHPGYVLLYVNIANLKLHLSNIPEKQIPYL